MRSSPPPPATSLGSSGNHHHVVFLFNFEIRSKAITVDCARFQGLFASGEGAGPEWPFRGLLAGRLAQTSFRDSSGEYQARSAPSNQAV